MGMTTVCASHQGSRAVPKQEQERAVSYYRKVYLKSDHWRGLRNAKLAERGAKCELCGYQSPHNDVHHLRYRKLYQVSLMDLRVLCRVCHDETHKLLEQYPGLSQLEAKPQWQVVREHLGHRIAIRKREKRRHKKYSRSLSAKIREFKFIRELLWFSGCVAKSRMTWQPHFDRDAEMEAAIDGFRSSGDTSAALRRFLEIGRCDVRPSYWAVNELQDA